MVRLTFPPEPTSPSLSNLVFFASNQPIHFDRPAPSKVEAFWEDMNRLYPAEFWVH